MDAAGKKIDDWIEAESTLRRTLLPYDGYLEALWEVYGIQRVHDKIEAILMVRPGSKMMEILGALHDEMLREKGGESK